MQRKYSQRGFTLIELMVTVAVMIVVLAIGIPAYDSMMASNRAVSQSNMFVTAINLAKSEAISRGARVTVCANASATNTTPSSLACATSGTNTWANGWFVFQDADSDGVYDSTGHDDETVLKLWQALEPGSTFSDGGTYALPFSSTGESLAGAVAFELTQNNAKGNQKRCLYVNALGQIRMERVDVAAACP